MVACKDKAVIDIPLCSYPRKACDNPDDKFLGNKSHNNQDICDNVGPATCLAPLGHTVLSLGVRFYLVEEVEDLSEQKS